MTYKLFDDTLKQYIEIQNPPLVRLRLVFDIDETEKRVMFFKKGLADDLMRDNPRKALNYTANIRSFIGRFVKGDEVDNEKYMKSWKGDIFELRVQNQRKKERKRIFGAFGAPDIFVALFAKERNYFGNSSDPRWDEAIERAIREWDSLFPGCIRVRARPFSNCVTSNYYDVNDLKLHTKMKEM